MMAMTQAVAALCVSILSEFDDGVSAALLGVDTFVLRPSLDFVLHHVCRDVLVLRDFLLAALVAFRGPRLQFRVADATDDFDACRATHMGLGPRIVGHHTLVLVLAHRIRT